MDRGKKNAEGGAFIALLFVGGIGLVIYLYVQRVTKSGGGRGAYAAPGGGSTPTAALPPMLPSIEDDDEPPIIARPTATRPNVARPPRRPIEPVSPRRTAAEEAAARLAARLAGANKVMEESSTAGASADGDAVERQPDSDDDEWM